MIHPEQLKVASLDLVREAGVKVLFHAWASRALTEDGRLRGVVYRKQGRPLRRHCTRGGGYHGDGDVFVSAGERSANDVEASSIQQCIDTAWLCGGVDCERWISFRASPGYEPFAARARAELGVFEWPIPGGRDDVAVFMGPGWAGYDGLDAQDLTAVELPPRHLRPAGRGASPVLRRLLADLHARDFAVLADGARRWRCGRAGGHKGVEPRDVPVAALQRALSAQGAWMRTPTPVEPELAS